MLSVDAIKAEIENLEKRRAQLIAGVQQTEGAIGFAKGLLAKAEKSALSFADVEAEVASLRAENERLKVQPTCCETTTV